MSGETNEMNVDKAILKVLQIEKGYKGESVVFAGIRVTD